MSDFPLIDLGGTSEPHTASHQRTAQQLRQALEHVGFFAVVNHGISPALIDDIFSQARRFHALPAEQKAALVFSPDFTGYVPPARHVLRTSTVNDNTMGDLNAAFFMEREEPPDGADGVRVKQFRTGNQWPSDLPGFRDVLMTYYRTMERFTRRRLLPLYAQALDLSIDYFDAAFRWPQASLRLSHYPPVPRQANQFGIAPHTDAGFLTILPQSEVDGLHIRPPGSDWIKAPRVEGGLFINSGDMLKRWTNDRFLSTQHMAVNGSNASRYAAVFFISPDLDYAMSCLPTCCDAEHPPKYEPITYRHYRTWFMDANYRPEAKPRYEADAVQ